jgi:hypothetical protein
MLRLLGLVTIRCVGPWSKIKGQRERSQEAVHRSRSASARKHAGEVVISDAIWPDVAGEQRALNLKGIAGPVIAHVTCVEHEAEEDCKIL